METSYGVVWREGERPPVTGKLELLPRGVWLDGLSSARQIPYEVISSVRIGRSSADRIGKSPSVVLERRAGDPVKISTVARPSLIGELAERLASLQLGAESGRRTVVVVPLKLGSRDAVRDLLAGGPPFDPERLSGLDRHEVFLTAQEAIFVFQSHLGVEALTPLLVNPELWAAAGEWRQHVDGPPRIAEDAYSWTRSEPVTDVSYLPTPGPGDSDGGDIY
jgi:hypothetical protein